MHRERVSHNAIIKPTRTWWQDPLITQVTHMTISPYIDVRRYWILSLHLTIERLKEFYSSSFVDLRNGHHLSSQFLYRL
jgi:hypothetical protein